MIWPDSPEPVIDDYPPEQREKILLDAANELLDAASHTAGDIKKRLEFEAAAEDFVRAAKERRMPETDQLTLAPEQPLEAEVIQLAVVDLVGKKKGRLIGPPPSTDFVESVKTFGILQPILVVDAGKTFKIRDGRRRLRAASEVGLEWIPAYVIKATGWNHDYLLSAIANEQRSDNGVATLEVLEQLRKEGVGEQETLEATGIAVARQRRLLKLLLLIAPIRRALEDGVVSLDIAEDVARLTPDQQTTLNESLKKNGSLTASDVRAVKGILERVKEAEGDIPDVELDWREKAVRFLREAQGVLPRSATRIRRSLDVAIAEVRTFEEPEEPQGPPITNPDRLPDRGRRTMQSVESRVGARLEDDETGDVQEV